MVNGFLSILADLDEIPIGITHVAAPFPPVIVERLGKKRRAFVAPLFIAIPDVGDTQIEETIHSLGIRWCFENDFRLVWSRATAGIENDPCVGQLDVAWVFCLDHFPAKNTDIEVFRFFLILYGEEVRGEESFLCN